MDGILAERRVNFQTLRPHVVRLNACQFKRGFGTQMRHIEIAALRRQFAGQFPDDGGRIGQNAHYMCQINVVQIDGRLIREVFGKSELPGGVDVSAKDGSVKRSQMDGIFAECRIKFYSFRPHVVRLNACQFKRGVGGQMRHIEIAPLRRQLAGQLPGDGRRIRQHAHHICQINLRYVHRRLIREMFRQRKLPACENFSAEHRGVKRCEMHEIFANRRRELQAFCLHLVCVKTDNIYFRLSAQMRQIEVTAAGGNCPAQFPGNSGRIWHNSHHVGQFNRGGIQRDLINKIVEER